MVTGGIGRSEEREEVGGEVAGGDEVGVEVFGRGEGFGGGVVV